MDLGKFLKQRDIIYTLCAATISTQIIIMSDILTNSFIMPLLNNNGMPSQINDKSNNSFNSDNIENFTVDIKGAKMEMGKLFIALIRLIIIFIILYIIYYLTC